MRRLALALVLLATMLAVPGVTHAVATTFTVNSADDVDDGTCDATHCSLREAIAAANANAGTDTIAFNIPGAGPHTIQPNSALPTITDPVVIDGYTQPGASPNTNGPGLGLNTVLKIELDGTNAGVGADGIRITSADSTVRGLVINRFGGPGTQVTAAGVNLVGSSGNVIEGNFIGTDDAGTLDLGNFGSGVRITAPSNTIGGTTAAARNVISGNGFHGVWIVSVPGGGNVVQGNFIGTDATGSAAIGNALTGVMINTAPGNTIGGTDAGARNVISSNGGGGIRIRGSSSTGNLVQGNFIGTDVTGTAKLGNLLRGVLIEAPDNIIGGMEAGAANTLAHNGGLGVHVFDGTGNAILGNAIFSNSALGIDLFPDGVTPNDTGDGDTGANNLQNFPTLSQAFLVGGTTQVGGSLNSTASRTFRVEFFANAACDASGNGEGETFLGAINVTTDGSGDTFFNATVGAASVGDQITATATDLTTNDTSEFSICATVLAGAPPETPVTGDVLVPTAALIALIAGLVFVTGGGLLVFRRPAA